MEDKVLIAPVGPNIDALYVGLKEYPVGRVVLLCSKNRLKLAEKAKKKLEKEGVLVKILEVTGNIWEEMFEKVQAITQEEANAEVLVNTSSGDSSTQCALTSAAFVNGLKAIAVDGGMSMLLPIMRFSYYKLLTDQKMKILKVLHEEETCCSSLEELGKRVKMSLPLISYHINGTHKSEGLKELGLVEVENDKKKVKVTLSILGRMLLKGHLSPGEEK